MSEELPIKIISSSRKSLLEMFREIIEYRELIWILAWRDIKVMYAETVLGLIWTIINPIINLVVLVILFNKIGNIAIDGVNPFLFGMVGIVAWTYFSKVVSECSNSIIGAQNMIKKVYFPRIIIPISKAIAAIPDLLASVSLLLVFLLVNNWLPSLHALYFPVFLALGVFMSITVGIWVSALSMRFRDFKHIVPVLIRVGMFATPIAIPLSQVPSKYLFLFYFNPLTSIIEAMRWALFDYGVIGSLLGLTIGFTCLAFFAGMYLFNYLSTHLADYL